MFRPEKRGAEMIGKVKRWDWRMMRRPWHALRTSAGERADIADARRV
jgi:hypothetical protein